MEENLYETTIARNSISYDSAHEDSVSEEGSKSSKTVEPVPKPPPEPLLVRLARFIDTQSAINPFSRFYYIWLQITSLCCMYNLVFIIARVAFWLLNESKYSFIWLLVDYLVCDVINIIDMYVKFMTGFMQNGELCFNRRAIALRYVRKVKYYFCLKQCLSFYDKIGRFLFKISLTYLISV